MKFKILILCLLPFLTSFSQEYSVHREHSEKYGIKLKEPSEFDKDGRGIIPLMFDKAKKNGTIIYGYLPDWEYATAKNYLRYDILTHISAFDFVVSNTGALSNPSGWPWTDVINTAHQNGVKVTLCAVNFNADDIHTIMTTPTVKQTLFNNIKSRIEQYQLDGVNIDFEGLNTADRGSVLNTFMTDLKSFMNTNLPGKEVSFAGPAITSGGWNVSGLAQACDFIFIMGYAYYGSWSATSGACAPLTGGSYNITNTVLTQYSSVVNSNPQKLVLGVPYYGLKWTTQTELPHATVIDYISSTRFRDDVTLVQQYGMLWAGDNQVPWYRYLTGTTWYQVWFDNDSSLGLKYALAQLKGLAGVGMWALGYDGARNELWNELHRRFYSQVPVELSSFSVENNFPVVRIKWKTASETNNRMFHLTRTLKGGEEALVAKVDGFGTTAMEKSYMAVDQLSVPGEYTYRLHQIDFNGTEKVIAEKNIELAATKGVLNVSDIYPNPAGSILKFKYELPEDLPVILNFYNVVGKRLIRIEKGIMNAGIHEEELNVSEISPGIYNLEILTGNSRQIKKALIIR